jgi:hypothetical protein
MKLSKEEHEFYKENGFILLDKIFSTEEIEECSETYDALFKEKQELHSNLEAQWAGDWNNKPGETKSVSFDIYIEMFNEIYYIYRSCPFIICNATLPFSQKCC